MEVAKVTKLSLELNKMGIKHIIFTLDDVSTKRFGDSTTLKRLKILQSLKLEFMTFCRNQNRQKMIWSNFVQHQMFDCWRQTLFMGMINLNPEVIKLEDDGTFSVPSGTKRDVSMELRICSCPQGRLKGSMQAQVHCEQKSKSAFI